ncbi:hypothetical protein AB0I61_24105 [Polymorphospora rubra]|uniref:GPP34 family phosphoprotein n=1 Tax=Polymorphospora rubra TaxID=338584 RepID=UPI0033F938BF
MGDERLAACARTWSSSRGRVGPRRTGTGARARLTCKELLDRVNTALHEPIGSIDPADAALVAIIAAGDLGLVLDRKTRRANKQRIQELTKLSGPIGPALQKSIQAAAIGEV